MPIIVNLDVMMAKRLIGIRFSDVAGECPTNPLRSGGFMRFM